MSTILFFSDLHGLSSGAEGLQKQLARLKPDRIAFLGDSLLPAREPAAIAFLNSLAHKISAVQGNCDGEREQVLLDFPLHPDYALINDAPHRFFLTHGVHWNPSHLPPQGLGDILCFGHTHIPELHRLASGVVAFNPGSCALPRRGFPPSFGFYDGNSLSVMDLESGSSLFDLSFTPNS